MGALASQALRRTKRKVLSEGESEFETSNKLSKEYLTWVLMALTEAQRACRRSFLSGTPGLGAAVAAPAE